MTEQLFQYDSYLTEFAARVTKVSENLVELDRSAFYPTGGGQPHDIGSLQVKENAADSYDVIEVKKTEGGNIAHVIQQTPNIKQNDNVIGKIDWQRRYKFMRMHTASHILASIAHDEFGAKIMGNQIGFEKTRFDFSLETFDRGTIEKLIEKTNEKIQQQKEVRVYFLRREEALNIPDITKLGGAELPPVDNLRIVEIADIDIQADGGTHVKNTKEIGCLELLKMENKGKQNRRMYFGLS